MNSKELLNNYIMDNQILPEKVKRFNFGAFMFPCLWSLFNRQYILSAVSGILYLLIWHDVFCLHSYLYHSFNWNLYDIILIAIRIIIGITGTRLAWNSLLKKKGADADPVSFRQKQFGWSVSGLTLIGYLLFNFLFYNYIPLLMELWDGNSYDTEEIDTICVDERKFELWTIYPDDNCRMMFRKINEYSNHKFADFVEFDDSIALGSVKKENKHSVDEILYGATNSGLIDNRLCQFIWSAHEDSGKLKLYAINVQRNNGSALLDGRSITETRVVPHGNTFDVLIYLDPEGSRVLKSISEEVYALTIDNKVYDIYPNKSDKNDDFRIRGFESEEEAETVADALLSAASSLWLWGEEDQYFDERFDL